MGLEALILPCNYRRATGLLGIDYQRYFTGVCAFVKPPWNFGGLERWGCVVIVANLLVGQLLDR